MRGGVAAVTINNHSETLSKATAIVYRQPSPALASRFASRFVPGSQASGVASGMQLLF
jgi:hypothetical protein